VISPQSTFVVRDVRDEVYGWRQGWTVDPYGLHWEIGHELT
jgi:hypothetical protein